MRVDRGSGFSTPRAAVVAHELQGRPAQLETVPEPAEDRRGLWPGQDPEADQEAAVIVDEADDPDLGVLALRSLEPERALDVDVPELVRPAPLVRGTALAMSRRSGRPEVSEQPVHRVMAERIDVPPGELGGEALRVPVREQAHHDHGLRNPVGQSTGCRTARLIEKTFESLGRVAKSPTMQAGAADAERQGCGDALLAADPDGPDPASQIRDLVSREASRRTTAAGREERGTRGLPGRYGGGGGGADLFDARSGVRP